MYDYIINPETLRKVNVNSKKGKSILNAYRNEMYGGSNLHIETIIAQDNDSNSYDVIFITDSRQQQHVTVANRFDQHPPSDHSFPVKYSIERSTEANGPEGDEYEILQVIDTQTREVIGTSATKIH